MDNPSDEGIAEALRIKNPTVKPEVIEAYIADYHIDPSCIGRDTVRIATVIDQRNKLVEALEKIEQGGAWPSPECSDFFCPHPNTARQALTQFRSGQ